MIDQAKYERLYHAGKTMTTATRVGVNRIEFNRLLREFGTEVRIAADKLTANLSDLASKMVDQYARAADAYVDSEELWGVRLVVEDVTYWGGKLPISDLAHAESIRAKYGVEFVEGKTEYTDKPFYGFPLELPQLIWGKAAEYIAQAERIYLGQLENP